MEDLRLEELDFSARRLNVRNSKNQKDRIVFLTETVNLALRDYLLVRGTGNGSDMVFLYRNAALKRSLIHSQLKCLGKRWACMSTATASGTPALRSY